MLCQGRIKKRKSGRSWHRHRNIVTSVSDEGGNDDREDMLSNIVLLIKYLQLQPSKSSGVHIQNVQGHVRCAY